MGKNSEAVDLFGLPPVEPRDARGRKAYRRNAEVAKKVALSRAMGRSIEKIGQLVGLDPKTLNKYYSRELDQASELVEAILDEAIFEAAIGEKRVGAQRLLRERLDRGKAAVPLKPQKATTRARVRKPMGKKEQALADAATAHEDTSWAGILVRRH